MKTKTVELYIDLHPNWHENEGSSKYLFAWSNPPPGKPEDNLRVRIIVELPEHPRHIDADLTVKCKACVVTP